MGGFTSDEVVSHLNTSVEQTTFDLKLFKNILTRSKKFLWFVGGMETLESTNERPLIAFSKFVRRSGGSYKKFEDQTEWKKFKLGRRLFSHQGSGGARRDSRRRGEEYTGQASSKQFHEERKNASSYQRQG